MFSFEKRKNEWMKKGTLTGANYVKNSNLCNKLDLGIKLNSEDGKGTEVKIIFPINSMTEM